MVNTWNKYAPVDMEMDYTGVKSSIKKGEEVSEENKKTFSAVEKKSGSAGKNLDLVKKMCDALVAPEQDLEAQKEFWNEDMIWHGPPGFGEIHSLEGFLRDELSVFYEAFPDFNGDFDIIFANEQEILSLIDTKKFDEAISFGKQLGKLIVITRGEKGSVAIKKNKVVECDIKKDLKIVDLTGAGDLFAAGFLHGYVNNLSTKQSLEKGTEMSSKVIQVFGARLKN